MVKFLSEVIRRNVKYMKSTNELMNLIKKAQREEFVDSIREESMDVSELMKNILAEKKVEIKRAIDMLILEPSYGYQIFNGRRKPIRIILLRFAIIFGLTIEETQQLLKMGQKQELYPKIRFDAAIIYGIEHHYSVEEVEDLLAEVGEKSLF